MPEPVYMALPDIVVNLNSTSRRTNYINLKITLELSKIEDIAVIESQMPRIIDAFNTYLRELRREDLQGSAGVYRLENELMLRLQKTLVKGEVKDILFREIIIQ
jgi:flagellar FliL protein